MTDNLLPSLAYREEIQFYVEAERKNPTDKIVMIAPLFAGPTLPYSTEREMIEQYREMEFETLRTLLKEKEAAMQEAQGDQPQYVHFRSEYHIIAKAIQEQQWPSIYPQA